MIPRDSKGRFIIRNPYYKGYIFKAVNGKNNGLHKHMYEAKYGKVPKGYVVHHINGDKQDNRIENLEMMTYKQHNKLHAKDRKIWNRGKHGKEIQEWHNKVQRVRKDNYFETCAIAWDLKERFGPYTTSALLDISRRQLYDRIAFGVDFI